MHGQRVALPSPALDTSEDDAEDMARAALAFRHELEEFALSDVDVSESQRQNQRLTGGLTLSGHVTSTQAGRSWDDREASLNLAEATVASGGAMSARLDCVERAYLLVACLWSATMLLLPEQRATAARGDVDVQQPMAHQQSIRWLSTRKFASMMSFEFGVIGLSQGGGESDGKHAYRFAMVLVGDAVDFTLQPSKLDVTTEDVEAALQDLHLIRDAAYKWGYSVEVAVDLMDAVNLWIPSREFQLALRSLDELCTSAPIVWWTSIEQVRHRWPRGAPLPSLFGAFHTSLEWCSREFAWGSDGLRVLCPPGDSEYGPFIVRVFAGAAAGARARWTRSRRQAVWVEMSENTWLWIRALPLPLESSLAEAVGHESSIACRFFNFTSQTFNMMSRHKILCMVAATSSFAAAFLTLPRLGCSAARSNFAGVPRTVFHAGTMGPLEGMEGMVSEPSVGPAMAVAAFLFSSLSVVMSQRWAARHSNATSAMSSSKLTGAQVAVHVASSPTSSRFNEVRPLRHSTARAAMVFERFSERTIKAVVLAQTEAQRIKQDHVGTEMMVVGLLAEGSGGAKALQALGVRLEEVRALPKRESRTSG
ncbi:Chaperone protein ClpC1, chloroplastic [Symbiodinium microadriaticum]|uniref:Chaperone protein ClpC1, chloroplastic n=1 Tax=Symbiodinium microadriaticum TaxID=2951 RepID=A0A1Q9C2A5_SYMMI|nr:Chaperone protein ClpC1, chloroplastic [Symbiodinium microadriaticum]